MGHVATRAVSLVTDVRPELRVCLLQNQAVVTPEGRESALTRLPLPGPAGPRRNEWKEGVWREQRVVPRGFATFIIMML